MKTFIKMDYDMEIKEQAREEYRNDDPAFAECWSDDDHDFYEWCSDNMKTTI